MWLAGCFSHSHLLYVAGNSPNFLFEYVCSVSTNSNADHFQNSSSNESVTIFVLIGRLLELNTFSGGSCKAKRCTVPGPWAVSTESHHRTQYFYHLSLSSHGTGLELCMHTDELHSWISVVRAGSTTWQDHIWLCVWSCAIDTVNNCSPCMLGRRVWKIK